MIPVLLVCSGGMEARGHASAMHREGETSFGSIRMKRSLLEECCKQKEYKSKGAKQEITWHI